MLPSALSDEFDTLYRVQQAFPVGREHEESLGTWPNQSQDKRN